MLTRSWGSWRTTTMVIAPIGLGPLVPNCAVGRRLSATTGAEPTADGRWLTADGASSDELQHPESTLILPVPPQPDPSVAAAPDELPRAPHAAREHLVDDQVEADAATDVRTTPVGRRDRRRDAIPGVGTAPGPTYHLRPAGGPARPAHAQPTGVPPLGHDQPTHHRTFFRDAQVDLDAVRVNVVRLVVQPEGRRVSRPEAEVGLRHVDREVQRLVVPVDTGRDRELFGAAVRFFAAALLLLHVEPQRFGGVEAIARAVERGRSIDAERGARDRRGALQLEQRLQRGRRGARAGEPDPLRANLHFPPLDPDRMPLDPPDCLHFHDLTARPHGPHHRRVRHWLKDGDESSGATPRPQQIERFPFLASRPAGPRRPQQLSREHEGRSQLSAVSVQLENDGALAPRHASLDGVRSEERRVGKECRSRWSPYH